MYDMSPGTQSGGSPRLVRIIPIPVTCSTSGFLLQSKVSFYNRAEKTHILAEDFPKLELREGERPVKVSDDPLMRNCIQCHAPNARHQAGTSDDRTPRGVHEGLTCLACHDPHSNDARQSCIKCHPAISNCKQDVTAMNTCYADPKSPNNIHWVAVLIVIRKAN